MSEIFAELYDSDVDEITVKVSVVVDSLLQDTHEFSVLTLPTTQESYSDLNSEEKKELSFIDLMKLSIKTTPYVSEYGFGHDYGKPSEYSDKTNMILVRYAEIGVEEVASENSAESNGGPANKDNE